MRLLLKHVIVHVGFVVAVESVYSAMCECQALHPDENDSVEGILCFHFICVSCITCYVGGMQNCVHATPQKGQNAD